MTLLGSELLYYPHFCNLNNVHYTAQPHLITAFHIFSPSLLPLLFTGLHYSIYLALESESLWPFHPKATLTRLSDIRRLKVWTAPITRPSEHGCQSHRAAYSQLPEQHQSENSLYSTTDNISSKDLKPVSHIWGHFLWTKQHWKELTIWTRVVNASGVVNR